MNTGKKYGDWIEDFLNTLEEYCRINNIEFDIVDFLGYFIELALLDREAKDES